MNSRCPVGSSRPNLYGGMPTSMLTFDRKASFDIRFKESAHKLTPKFIYVNIHMTVIFGHFSTFAHMIDNLLKAFQLSGKEITVFKKVLELGPQPASSIARIAELPRNTVRNMLDSLSRKGLIAKTRRGNTQYYSAETKESLIRILEHRLEQTEQEVKNQIGLLEKYGDELSVRHYAKSRPKITFYEGTSGLEKVYEDTLTAKNGLRSWGSFDANRDALPDYFTTYYRRRAKKKIPMISIHPDTKLSREYQEQDRKELRSSVLVPCEKFTLTPEIQIYNDKVNIVSWKDKLGIIIESQEIADALGAIFNLSYEAAEKYGKKSQAKRK